MAKIMKMRAARLNDSAILYVSLICMFRVASFCSQKEDTVVSQEKISGQVTASSFRKSNFCWFFLLLQKSCLPYLKLQARANQACQVALTIVMWFCSCFAHLRTLAQTSSPHRFSTSRFLHCLPLLAQISPSDSLASPLT